jgi:ATPase family associated with various cellular activities (AAA)
MHFADLVLRGALPHAARYDWAIGDCSFDEIECLAIRSGRGEGVRTALLDLGNELGAEAWAYLSIGAGGVSVWIGAAEQSLLDAGRDWVRARLPEAGPQGSSVPIAFWSLGSYGASRLTRTLEVPPWTEIAGNYPRAVRAQLVPLLSGGPPTAAGQLLLWHGEPGAGKTHVVRALAWEWRGWCDVHYVTDPEEFFGRAAYMLEVIVDEDGDEDDERWRLLVLEDTGELLSADAKERTGQGLSRFLNVVDGILGQGLRLLVLVTTNELLRRLHPAVSRPGRCASAVEFTSFTADEAARWLAARGLESEHRSRTLAELYAKAEGREAAVDDERRVGF